MKIVLVSKCSLDIEQYVEFKTSVLISPSKSLISLRWVTYGSNKRVKFDICMLLYNLTSDNLWPSYVIFDFMHVWRPHIITINQVWFQPDFSFSNETNLTFSAYLTTWTHMTFDLDMWNLIKSLALTLLCSFFPMKNFQLTCFIYSLQMPFKFGIGRGEPIKFGYSPLVRRSANPKVR